MCAEERRLERRRNEGEDKNAQQRGGKKSVSFLGFHLFFCFFCACFWRRFVWYNKNTTTTTTNRDKTKSETKTHQSAKERPFITPNGATFFDENNNHTRTHTFLSRRVVVVVVVFLLATQSSSILFFSMPFSRTQMSSAARGEETKSSS